ncbi:hypothetical protein ABZT26_37525 [Streptomyces sp. NPDC005395]|uniref:DUF7739 domain-containing protein n=1 Tax=Streptomyces sp. NPDC005395 TaxID=3157042 RepID=UPI0033B314B0
MSTVVQVSHGADFFGTDHYDPAALNQVAAYATGTLPADGRDQLVRLLEHATETEHEVPADQAVVMAGQLRRIARSRYTRPKVAAWAMRLGDAAARAGADGEPWTWTPTTAA